MILRQSDTEIESQSWSMHVTMMHMLGGNWQRNVFNLNLNVSNDKLFLMSIEIVFHIFIEQLQKNPGLREQFECGKPQEIRQQMI